MISTMQRLAAQVAHLRRERALYWALTAVVVGFQAFKLFKGVL